MEKGTLFSKIRELLKEAKLSPDELIVNVREVRDTDKANAKAALDRRKAELDAEYKAAGLPIRTLGPRKPAVTSPADKKASA